MSEHMSFSDSSFELRRDLMAPHLSLWIMCACISLWIYSLMVVHLCRRRERRHSESAATRRTPCVVAVAPRLTIFRSVPVGSVDTLQNARGSVSIL